MLSQHLREQLLCEMDRNGCIPYLSAFGTAAACGVPYEFIEAYGFSTDLKRCGVDLGELLEWFDQR